MKLDQLIRYKVKAKEKEIREAKEAEDNGFDSKVRNLLPMLTKLQKALEPFDMHPEMHTDKEHWPCPAIHVRYGESKGHSPIYDKIGEMHLDNNNHWRAGGCNQHNYSFKDDEGLLEHVAEAVSECLTKRYR